MKAFLLVTEVKLGCRGNIVKIRCINKCQWKDITKIASQKYAYICVDVGFSFCFVCFFFLHTGHAAHKQCVSSFL